MFGCDPPWPAIALGPFAVGIVLFLPLFAGLRLLRKLAARRCTRIWQAVGPSTRSQLRRALTIFAPVVVVPTVLAYTYLHWYEIASQFEEVDRRQGVLLIPTVPAFDAALADGSALDAFLYFEWMPDDGTGTCIIGFQVHRHGEQAVNVDAILFYGIWAYEIAVDPSPGPISSIPNSGRRTYYYQISSACDRTEEIAQGAASYINHHQDFVEFVPVAPTSQAIAAYRRHAHFGADVPAEVWAAKRAAIAAECDSGLWRHVGEVVGEGQDPAERVVGQALYGAYADAIEGRDFAPNLPDRLSSAHRRAIIRIITYQMEHGPCGGRQ